jgi:hypothetical protein
MDDIWHYGCVSNHGFIAKMFAATMEVTNPWDLRVQFLDAKKTQQTYSSSSVTIPDYGKEDPTWLEKIDTSSIHKLSF